MNECCKKEENLELDEKNGNLTVKKCKVCGLRHYEVNAEPGMIGIKTDFASLRPKGS